MSSGLSPKDRRALLWGGPVVALLLLYLLTRGDGAARPPERLPADAPATVEPAPLPVTALPAPVAPVATEPVAVTPAADAGQLRLVGILSSGALIAMADGTQRFIPVGREVVPGVVLRGVDVHQAILATPGGEVRLPLDAGAGAAPPAPAVTVAAPRAGPPPTP